MRKEEERIAAEAAAKAALVAKAEEDRKRIAEQQKKVEEQKRLKEAEAMRREDEKRKRVQKEAEARKDKENKLRLEREAKAKEKEQKAKEKAESMLQRSICWRHADSTLFVQKSVLRKKRLLGKKPCELSVKPKKLLGGKKSKNVKRLSKKPNGSKLLLPPLLLKPNVLLLWLPVGRLRRPKYTLQDPKHSKILVKCSPSISVVRSRAKAVKHLSCLAV